jgi:hypothetical protein
MTKKKNTQKPKENIKRLNGSELAELIGIETEKYNDFQNPKSEYEILDPKEIFKDTTKIILPKRVYNGFKKVNDGNYMAGNIYWDGIYKLMHLYLGKFNYYVGKNNIERDLTIGLGGLDELYKGIIEKGTINPLDETIKVKGIFLEGVIDKKNIFFENEVIFSLYKKEEK